MIGPRIRSGLLLFLHPDLFGSYVLAAVFSAAAGFACSFGYACFFRVGGFVPLVLIPTMVISWSIVLAGGALQRWLWRRITKPAAPRSSLPGLELLTCSILATVMMLFSGIWIGEEVCESRARQTCRRADTLLSMLQKEKDRTGSYPSNLRAFVKTNVPWRREVLFYYGETNGVEWLPHHVANAHITLMTVSNQLE